MSLYLQTVILSACLALIFTPLVIFQAKKWEVFDYPSERRVHQIPVPRLGGIAIYLSFWLTIFYLIDINRMITGFFVGSTVLFLVGIVDDIRGMRALHKFFWQILAAVIPLFFSVPQITLPFLGTVPGIVGYLFAVFWIVGVVNTVNMSDGLDGLAAGICFMAALLLFWSAYRIHQEPATYLLLALAGAALGFLVFNFHPARIFMGDSGSMFLGYILGAVSIWALLKTAAVIGLVFPLLVLGMPLIDMLFAIVRRKWKGFSIARADMGHLHHRLLDVGLSQRQAVLILYGISACFSLAAILCVYGSWYWAVLLLLLNLALIFIIMLRKFHLYRLFRKKRLKGR